MRARRLEVCGASMGERAGEGVFFFPSFRDIHGTLVNGIVLKLCLSSGMILPQQRCSRRRFSMGLRMRRWSGLSRLRASL